MKSQGNTTTRVRRIESSVKWAEIAIAVGTLAAAMWQLLLIDGNMIGFVGFWMLPPLIAVGVRLRYRSRPELTTWATAYLFFTLVGNLLASTALFPSFEAKHPGATEFAERWNQLDLTSRRMISWSMTTSGGFLFAWTGYILFYKDLRWRLRHGESDFSVLTSVLGLATLWLLPGLAVVGLFVSAFRR